MRSALALLLLLLPGVAAAFEPRHVALTAAERKRTFPLRFEPAGCGAKPMVVDGLTIERDSVNERVLVRGVDRVGHPFQVVLPLRFQGCQLRSGDIDGDGRSDLVLTSGIGGEGLSPPTDVTLLLRDATGRPVLWTTPGWFSAEAGVDAFPELLDLDGDRHAELIQMSFNGSWWATEAYRMDAGEVRRVERPGPAGFPRFTRHTEAGSHQPVRLEASARPFFADLDTTLRPAGALKAMRGLGPRPINSRLAASEGPVPTLLTATEGRCAPDPWFASSQVVLDVPTGRRIATFGTRRDFEELLLEAERTGLELQLGGKRRAEGCSPERFVFRPPTW